MENDEPKNINIIISNNHTSTSVFNLEYNNQNLNNNIEYQKWKKLMLIQYRDNSKQFKCNKDKILFYSSYNDYINNYSYKSKCPVCNNNICYFCSFNNSNYFYLPCCITNSILKTFFYSGLKSLNEPFIGSNLFFLIPILNIFTIIFAFFKLLYTDLILEKSKNNNNEEYVQYVDLYIKKSKKSILNYILILLIDLFLCIPFIITYNYFIILLIIISIPFKFIPLKYYLGAFYED